MAVLSKQAVAKAKAKVVKKPAIKQTTDLLRKPASSTSEKSEKTEKGGLNLTIDQLKSWRSRGGAQGQRQISEIP